MTVLNAVGGAELLSPVDSMQTSVQAIPAGGSNIGTSRIIHVSGSVDWTNSSQLRMDIRDLLQSVRPARVIVDLAGVTHLDSSGIGALLASLRDAKEKHVGFLLAALNGSQRRLLERIKLHTIFDIRPTVQDALRA